MAVYSDKRRGNCQKTIMFWDRPQYETLACPVVTGGFMVPGHWELALCTQAEFGCVQWEEKPVEEKKKRKK